MHSKRAFDIIINCTMCACQGQVVDVLIFKKSIARIIIITFDYTTVLIIFLQTKKNHGKRREVFRHEYIARKQLVTYSHQHLNIRMRHIHSQRKYYDIIITGICCDMLCTGDSIAFTIQSVEKFMITLGINNKSNNNAAYIIHIVYGWVHRKIPVVYYVVCILICYDMCVDSYRFNVSTSSFRKSPVHTPYKDNSTKPLFIAPTYMMFI